MSRAERMEVALVDSERDAVETWREGESEGRVRDVVQSWRRVEEDLVVRVVRSMALYDW